MTFLKNLHRIAFVRSIGTTQLRPLKESMQLSSVYDSNLNLLNLMCSTVQVKQSADSLVVSGEYVESARRPFLLQEAAKSEKKFCPKCTLGLDIKHTDVLILSQYVRSDGCMLPQRITGLCRVQQKKIGTLVTMAQKAGKSKECMYVCFIDL